MCKPAKKKGLFSVLLRHTHSIFVYVWQVGRHVNLRLSFSHMRKELQARNISMVVCLGKRDGVK